MSRFQAQGAQEYDARIGTLVPGYATLHATSAALLRARLPEQARVLVVGAGTGAETVALARIRPRWRFCALDPSADMLAIAIQKCREQQITNVDFVTGYVCDVPDGAPYDAVLCLLVMHFLPDRIHKLALLRQMAARLRPQGLLLLCDLMAGDATERDAMVCYATAHGLPESQGAALQARLAREFFPLRECDWHDLAMEGGFSRPELYYRALGFSAYVAAKNA